MESFKDIRNQHIKDVKLALEYKYLMKSAPSGIYILPEFENLRCLHGVIFVRRGLYRDGVFRFRIDLPKIYNEEGTYPLVTFTPPIFNPLIDITTGKLDLKADEGFRSGWNPDKHFLIHIIVYIKKIFFLRSYDSYPKVINEEAKQL
jgi:ubiquitin-protein ligase